MGSEADKLEYVLQRSLQIHHIYKVYTTLIYRVVIMISKEIWHDMRAYKATFFIKGYCQRAVAGSHLQYRKLSAVFFNKKFNQFFGIAFSLKWGNCSDILNFKYPISFICYDTLAFHSVIIKNIHFTFIEITANHIFLLIRQ